MTDHTEHYSTTTPDGYTIRATTCRAVIECVNPEGGAQITGMLIDVGGSLTYAHLAPTSTLSPDGLRALSRVLEGVQDTTGSPQNDEQPEPVHKDGPDQTEAAGQCTGPWPAPRSMADLAEEDWQSYYDTTDTMVSLKARAASAEAERDNILTELRDLRDSTFTDTRHALTEIIADHAPEG